jgi:hypothetical protein
MVDELARVIPPHQARVMVTYKREHGELPDPVTFDATDGDIRGWVSEAIRTGGVPGITADPQVRLNDYVIDRFAPVPGVREHNLIDIRPKVEFG